MGAGVNVRVLEYGQSDDLEDVPCAAGVYTFISPRGLIRYIGHAGEHRLYHEAERSFYGRKKGVPGDGVVWFVTADKAQAAALEQALIAEFRPQRNGKELVTKARRVLPGWLYDLFSFIWFSAGLVGLAKLIEWGWEIFGHHLMRLYRAVTGA